ncbi:MAG: GntR family transcriptional regulator [Nocardiopsaceae bacterium]|nr:GntR family transcriptional regulator [Nocardiopsaceae bacterium]
MTLAQQIRDSLVSRIVSGEVSPGERLVVSKLAAAYGTSQAPVREALRDLEAMRMVATTPRRGTFVRHFVQQTLREAYAVRAALEETATRVTMLAGTVPLHELRADVQAMREAARRDDPDASMRASVSFHRHVIEAAGNELLAQSWEALQIEARTAVTVLVTKVTLDEITSDHALLLETIESGDPEAACRAAREHQWTYAELPHDALGRDREELVSPGREDAASPD